MNTKVIAMLLLLIVAPVSAIELSLVGNDHFGVNFVKLGLSETATVSIWMDMGEDDGNVWGWSVEFDATPLRERSSVGYDIVGRKFTLTNNDDDRWGRVIPWSGDPNIEKYYSAAIDQFGPGTDGPWRGAADNLLIHATRIGAYELYFENQVTSDHDPPSRGPILADRDYDVHLYHRNVDLPGFVHFRNAWIDEEIGFDVPFRVIVAPEPASLPGVLFGALIVLYRRLN